MPLKYRHLKTLLQFKSDLGFKHTNDIDLRPARNIGLRNATGYINPKARKAD